MDTGPAGAQAAPESPRDVVFDVLRRELVGPSPEGPEVDCATRLDFSSRSDVFGPYRQKGSGDEILFRDWPTRRYGVGVLYPSETPADLTSAESNGYSATETPNDDPASPSFISEVENALGRVSREGHELDDDDLDLSDANRMQPSSMSISFLLNLVGDETIVVELPRVHPERGYSVNGRYVPKRDVFADGRQWTWWLRRQVEARFEFAAADILACSGLQRVVPTSKPARRGMDGMGIDVALHVRMVGGHRIATATLRVTRPDDPRHLEHIDEACLFQSLFSVALDGRGRSVTFSPYPMPMASDPEHESMRLLFRNEHTYAIGHGCAASWIESGSGTRLLIGECLPSHETPSVTPDIKDSFGNPVRVAMARLAGLVPNEPGDSDLEAVVRLYSAWIADKEAEVGLIGDEYRFAAERHLAECRRAAERMEEGLSLLKRDARVRRAFELANHAVLLQQLRTTKGRMATLDAQAERLLFDRDPPKPDIEASLAPDARRGVWRAFQIGFLLMSIASTARRDHVDRETVDLIWFPTGGGKTEAYLGLASFAIFLRRLNDPLDTGVEVLMRYTLRLLTAQQFQRAARLVCAMEYLRRRRGNELGECGFSAGVWLGGSTTPNKRESALSSLKQLSEGVTKENPFLVTSCPWCGAQMGPVLESTPPRGRRRGRRHPVVGYRREGRPATVGVHCSDPECEFWDGLPLYVVDDDLYERRPDLVIATVDKFAQLAWNDRVRSLFGIGESGARIASPPGLIIQDELHLIAGPLGSMTGLYEGLVELLCEVEGQDGAFRTKPKIVCSTATIRTYRDQVLKLYGRREPQLFPPPGLEIGDSFFGVFERDKDGQLAAGRRYVGVHAPSLGSMQTVEVRSMTALLQAPMFLEADKRDPYWTLLTFFNSLRELGTTLTLLQSDVRDYTKAVRNRWGRQHRMRRYYNVQELTGRIRNDQVPEALKELERSYEPANAQIHPVDVSLASSIIEVGVDVDRLALLMVVGQPKTTGQYIQVTGRVGRNPAQAPGLVVTLYGATKPRDRSHFEKHKTYHQELYAQVEPTSLTPYSLPALERGLHAVMVGYVRQTMPIADIVRPQPLPVAELNRLKQLLRDRVRNAEEASVHDFDRVFDRRVRQWQYWPNERWAASQESANPPLLNRAGSYSPARWRGEFWDTPNSMRNVDAECRASLARAQWFIGEELS